MTEFPYDDWTGAMPDGVSARYYGRCDSTNTRASDYLVGGEAKPCWFVASEQTAGRARRGRAWTSNPGNLFTSLAFLPSIRPSDLGPLPFIVALSVRDTFIALGADPAAVKCKWPNDLLINEKKACGILIESSASAQSALDYVIIGIGMNLLHSPDDAVFEATSFKAETGQTVSLQEAMTHLAARLKYRLDDWTLGDFAPIAAEWTDCAWGLGQTRMINAADRQFEATLIGLDEDGGLRALLATGEETTIVAADIFPVGGKVSEGY